MPTTCTVAPGQTMASCSSKQREVDDSAIGLMPRGTAARTPASLLFGRAMAIGEQILDCADHWYGLIN